MYFLFRSGSLMFISTRTWKIVRGRKCLIVWQKLQKRKRKDYYIKRWNLYCFLLLRWLRVSPLRSGVSHGTERNPSVTETKNNSFKEESETWPYGFVWLWVLPVTSCYMLSTTVDQTGIYHKEPAFVTR